jgi:ActR/RegA family two-component response regulator
MDRFVCDEGLFSGVGRREARVIAVVGDDKSFRDALQRFLRMHGFEVEAF